MKKRTLILGLVGLLSAISLLLFGFEQTYNTGRLGTPTRPVSSWKMQRENSYAFEYAGAKINYIKFGAGSPIVLIHGGGSWSYSFRNNIEPLSKQFSVFAIDIPGAGYSDIPGQWKYSLEDISSLLKDFVEQVVGEPAHLVGNSWGGGWAIHFSETYPKLVRSLVLISSSGLARSNEYDQSGWGLLATPIGNAVLASINYDVFHSEYENSLYYDKKKVTSAVVAEVSGPFQYRPNLYSQREYQIHLDWNETDKGLSHLRNVTIIWGSDDRYYSLVVGEELHRRIPGSKLFVIPETRHLPHEESPESVNELIVQAASF